MSQYYRLTYVRKQVITDFLPDGSTQETTKHITEVISGLPSSTVANYREVLGDQVVLVEVDGIALYVSTYGEPEIKNHRTGSKTVRQQITGKAATVVAEDDDALTGSYAGIITKLAKKANAA